MLTEPFIKYLSFVACAWVLVIIAVGLWAICKKSE